MTTSIASHTLNNGYSMLKLGLGCWMGKTGEGVNVETLTMVKDAIKAGYRHFDTAAGYGNEQAVGQAIRDSGIPRKEFFITTKLMGLDHGRVHEAFDASNSKLGLDYVDLYLVHWPQATDPETRKVLPPSAYPTIGDTWKDMEALLKTDKVRSIGVSNFSVKTLTELLQTADIIPTVNQFEAHPYLPQDEVAELCQRKGIFCTAYSPLGQYNSPLLSDPVIVKIAETLKVSVAQVLLSWGIQRGNFSVVPKSSNPVRQAQNMELLTLSPEDFRTLSELHREPGKHRSLCGFGGGGLKTKDHVYGWSLEEMGWDKIAFAHHWEVK